MIQLILKLASFLHLTKRGSWNVKSVSHTLNYVSWLMSWLSRCVTCDESYISWRVAWRGFGVAGGLLAVAQLDTLTSIQNIQGMILCSSALIWFPLVSVRIRRRLWAYSNKRYGPVHMLQSCCRALESSGSEVGPSNNRSSSLSLSCCQSTAFRPKFVR